MTTIVDAVAAALDSSPGAQPATHQWRAESLQLANWGGFDGYHKINIADTVTLLSGASGTGKSTLLDSYIALMMDSNTPFNGASNDNVTGRARSSDQRNILSYVRGKLDTSREAATGRLRDDVLRGQDSSTWSGVAMTWKNDAGERFTALRLYYAPVSATGYGDVGKDLATIDRSFDLSEVDDFASDRFPHRPMTARFPGLAFHESYTTFAATLHTRLGIGANGDGAKALKLLARIQGGRQVATVDGLYKDMVLEEPKTFAAADSAVAHFDDIEASYETMKTAAKQVDVLNDIPQIHASMITAQDEVSLIETLRADASERATPFSLWWRQVEADLLTKAISDNRATYQDAYGRADAARIKQGPLQEEIASLVAQQRANGGDALEAIERALDLLGATLNTTQAALTAFERQTEAIRGRAATQQEFDALRASSDVFLDNYDERYRALQDDRDQTIKEAQPLQTRCEDLKIEAASLKGRHGLVPHDLHTTRLTVANSMGLTADDLPFVAELIDMEPEFEAWREAAELALGGFALTMLVDKRRLPELRRRIDPLRFQRRVRFEGVPFGLVVPTLPSSDSLPGRMQTKETPFTGWLRGVLIDKFGYECVEDSDQLNHHRFGLSITGQTSDGARGAHGGHGRPRVIGFSNAGRLQEIAGELEHSQLALIALAQAKQAVENNLKVLVRQRDAHKHVTFTSWTSIDVAGVKAQIEQKETQQRELLQTSNLLAALKAREQLLSAELHVVNRARYGAENDQTTAETEHTVLLEDQQAVEGYLAALLGDSTVVLTADQSRRLQAELDRYGDNVAIDTFRRFANQIKKSLQDDAVRASRAAAVQERLLTSAFKRFQEQWPRPNLGEGVDSYHGYREILDDLLAEGLYERRAKFSRQVSDWTGIDLLRLHGAYEESIEEIEARLVPVNDILAQLPFGAGRDRLHINLHRRDVRDIAQFRKELKILASGTTEVASDAEIEARFERLRKFINRIRKSDKSTQREYLIDVRKHVDVDAERRDISGRQLSVYTSLGGKSGGETQELVAFIVGAALRYQLGDANLTRPRYAPVFLDEGFVKSDSEFAGRAVSAWTGLGFQLIIGAPNDKVTAIEPYADLLLQVTKNGKSHSHVTRVLPRTSAFAPRTLT